MKHLYNWLQFIKERFNPTSYLLMIFVFLGAHYALYRNFAQQEIALVPQDILYLIPLALAVLLFFFKLRLFDEVKDIKSDAIHHPKRPLPRGILKKKSILRVVFVIIVLEILLFSLYGLWALVGIIVTIIYSLIMYKEFFLKKWIRSHLTIYAVTHTFIVIFISITIFLALFKTSIIEIPLDLIFFSFAGWFLFNIFEFGRKTYAQQEEKEGVNSYSKIFGRFGAVLLVIIMAFLSMVFINKVKIFTNNNLLFGGLGLIGISGLLYIVLDRPYFAKIYRAVTSLYIVFVYVTLMILWLY